MKNKARADRRRLRELCTETSIDLQPVPASVTKRQLNAVHKRSLNDLKSVPAWVKTKCQLNAVHITKALEPKRQARLRLASEKSRLLATADNETTTSSCCWKPDVFYYDDYCSYQRRQTNSDRSGRYSVHWKRWTFWKPLLLLKEIPPPSFHPSSYCLETYWTGVSIDSSKKPFNLKSLRDSVRLLKLCTSSLTKMELPRHLSATRTLSPKQEGVIYAIYSPGDSRIYIGQTIRSPLHRFCEHVRWARYKPKDRIHKFILEKGYKYCFIFSLEIFDRRAYDYHSKPSKQRVKSFRKAARVREKFWINRLRTGRLLSGGLNTEHGTWNRRILWSQPYEMA